MSRTLPDHLKHLAPRREDYPDEEDYQEALAFFRHRVGSSIPQTTPRRSKGSRSE